MNSPRRCRAEKDEALVDVRGPSGRATISGPSLTVIALVAVLGLIWIATKALSLGQHALDRSPESSKQIDPP